MRCYDRWFRRSLHFDSDGGGGGGSGASDDGVSQEELERQAQQAVEDGRAIQKITRLLEDNYQLRDERRNLQDRLPGEGEVVLSPDQADQLREMGALGEDGTLQVEDVQERLDEAESAQEELEAYRRREARQEVFEAAELNEQAAEDILSDDLEYEVETSENDDGEEEKEAYVVTEDGKRPVQDYIQDEYSEPIQNALFSSEGSAGDSGDGEGSGSSSSVPQQTPTDVDEPGGGEGDPVESFIEDRNKSRLGQEESEE